MNVTMAITLVTLKMVSVPTQPVHSTVLAIQVTPWMTMVFAKTTTNVFSEIICVTVFKVFVITMLALTLVPVLPVTKLSMACLKVTFVKIPMNVLDQTCVMLMPHAITPLVLILVHVTPVTKTLIHPLSQALVTKVPAAVKPPHRISLVPTVSTLMNVLLELMPVM